MRMVSSPGKSIRRRREICPGLHALAHRRCCRRPCRRPFQATAGPTTAAPPGVATAPDRRSCTYVRRAAVVASLALFGRRAARSACHCAVLARYASPPLRVAALRRNSREIVDAARPSRRAISRMPWPCARHSAISSRSANTRYRSDGGFADGASVVGGMPPASRNQRAPTAGDTPASIAAASLDRPAAIAAQNRRRFSRCATPGRPGARGNTARSARSERRLPALIATPSVKGLRRPVEPEAFGRDEIECLIERQGEGSEVSRRGPGLAPPPQDLHGVRLAGRPQPRNRTTGAPAVERIAAVRSSDRNAPTWPRVGGDPLAHRINPGHRDHLRSQGLVSWTNQLGEGLCHADERARGAGRVDAALWLLLRPCSLAPRSGPGGRGCSRPG